MPNRLSFPDLLKIRILKAPILKCEVNLEDSGNMDPVTRSF